VLVIGGYYGAGILDRMPWLKASVTGLAIVFFVVGTVYGAWRYRKEMAKLRAKEAEEAGQPEPAAQATTAPVVQTPRPTTSLKPAVKTQG